MSESHPPPPKALIQLFWGVVRAPGFLKTPGDSEAQPGLRTSTPLTAATNVLGINEVNEFLSAVSTLSSTGGEESWNKRSKIFLTNNPTKLEKEKQDQCAEKSSRNMEVSYDGYSVRILRK